VPIKRLGTQDQYGQSGKPEDLFKEYGIDPESIYQEAKAFVKKAVPA
jgi:transketolase C-terminal domain/subunit